MTCWNYWGRVLSSFFYVFGNPGGGDRSVGNPRSSHFLLKSWDQSSLKLGVLRFLRVRWKSRGWRPECWKSQVITCLVEIIVFFLRIWKSRGRRPETGQVITCLVEIIGAEFSQVLSFFYVFGGNPGGGDRSALNPIGSFKAVDNRTEILGSEM